MIQAQILLDRLTKHELKLATAESCTGGLLSSYITSVPGSSHVLERGFVTYSNEAKYEMLGVPTRIIDHYGAVSPEVAVAMAEGAIKNSHSHISVAITGIAGPDGGGEHKPVGLVYIATSFNGRTRCYKHHFSGNRIEIRHQAAIKAFEHLTTALG